jgi:hypothetical protein
MFWLPKYKDTLEVSKSKTTIFNIVNNYIKDNVKSNN